MIFSTRHGRTRDESIVSSGYTDVVALTGDQVSDEGASRFAPEFGHMDKKNARSLRPGVKTTWSKALHVIFGGRDAHGAVVSGDFKGKLFTTYSRATYMQ